jgi:acetyl-CoA synthetase
LSGTEIGGSFLSSTLIHKNVPAMFSTPVLGSRFLLQNEEGKSIERSSFEKDKDGSEGGELVLVPPTVGLSTTLLNRDHYTEYYEGMSRGPNGEVLRRHGDEVECVRSSLHLPEEDRNSTTPYFRALGRSDDTMNIGGKEKYLYRQ